MAEIERLYAADAIQKKGEEEGKLLDLAHTAATKLEAKDGDVIKMKVLEIQSILFAVVNVCMVGFLSTGYLIVQSASSKQE